MHLSGHARVFGLFGDPVCHSLSPCMQNQTFRKYNIDAVYVPYHVLPNQLPGAVEGIRCLGLSGVNITVPHKEAILPFLDEVDPAARLIGAVNTIINSNGLLKGYNTDASGFIRSIQECSNFVIPGKRALILGAGGASRAALVALAGAGIRTIMLANRTKERAQLLVEDLGRHFPKVQLVFVTYDDTDYFSFLAEADLVVNTTSVGLKNEEISFLPLECIKGGALIYDMVYSLSETPLIKMACSCGLSSLDGLGMLAAQGEDAFALWTGVKPEAGFMRQVLEECRSIAQ